MMLVHSFSAKHAWFEDFRTFANALGAPVNDVDQLSEPVEREGLSLRLAWVADRPKADA
jgi:hypothetical protein